MSLLELWAAAAAALAAGAVVLWRVSLGRRDASLVDSAWGPAFVLVAALGAALGGGALGRRLVLLVLVTIWGVRLGLHIHARNRGRGEDPRYGAMRAAHGERFGRRSLVTVFLLQAALALAVAAPLVAAATAPGPAALGALDLAGAALWLAGFLFEAIGDAQLARFRADPANRGKVMDRGLWRTTRHPNYFGDAALWWGFGLFGLATGAWWSLGGPLLMTVLLVKVSGKALLERGLAASKPGYAAYVARTSGFVPWFPRRG
jgi:steroid 5-alpha reductase family enzyme